MTTTTRKKAKAKSKVIKLNEVYAIRYTSNRYGRYRVLITKKERSSTLEYRDVVSAETFNDMRINPEKYL